MDTLDTENRENSTSFGSGTNTYGDIDTLIREMFSYWDRIKESNPGSVASNEVKDPITMVKDYADSLLTSRDTYWKERVGETRTALLFVGEKVLKEISEIYAVDIKYADKKQWLEPSEFERIFLHRFNEAGLKALDTVIEKIKNK